MWHVELPEMKPEVVVVALLIFLTKLEPPFGNHYLHALSAHCV